MDDRDVVSCVLRRGTEVLLLRRSDAVGTYRGLWGFVSGYAEGSPPEAARREIAEEVGLLEACSLVRSADPLEVEDDDLGVRWRVHPFCFECESTAVEPNEEVADREWVQPPAILDRETVPRLWETYRAVAPTPEAVRRDAEHGSAYVSLRALEVLRDAAADAAIASDGDGGEGYDDVAALARRLRDARPSMGVLATRIDRVMAAADPTPGSILERAVEACERAATADAEAAGRAADLLGSRVLTLSRSGTVLEALERAAPEAVFVAESRPAREGVGVAEALADEGLDVSLCVDAAMGHVVARESVDTVLVGADAVLADGTIVNKTGTRLAALAASAGDVDCLVACSRDKIVPGTEPTLESGPPGAVYDGEAAVGVLNPTFEAVPPALVDGVVTEGGTLSTDDVSDVAAEHEELARWTRERSSDGPEGGSVNRDEA